MKRREILKRFGDPTWLRSQARDLALDARVAVSRGEFATLYRAIRPYTMSGNARLRGLYRAVHGALDRDVPGDIVECGTARGGSAALMGLVLRQRDAARRLWVFDTFEGLPQPTAEDPDYDLATLYAGSCRGSLEEVTALFERLRIRDRSVLVKGLFQDTLPRSAVDPIAILHLDGDWYESVKVCLDALYDRVSSGGVIQIDDYGHWEGARRAVDGFMQDRGLRTELIELDYTGRQLVKP